MKAARIHKFGDPGPTAGRSRYIRIVIDGMLPIGRGHFAASFTYAPRVFGIRWKSAPILVNNAGGTVPTPLPEDVPPLVAKLQGAPKAENDFERTALYHAYAIQNNLTSPLWFCLRAARQMLTQDGIASIVNISSGASHPVGSPLWSRTGQRSLE